MSLEELAEMVGLQLGRENVRPRDRIYEDLGGVSMDLMNLAAAVEERTGIFIPEEELAEVSTVLDLHALIERHDEGARG